jgi:hypothetical protein
MRKCFDLLLLLLFVVSSCSSGNVSSEAIVEGPNNVGVLATLKTNEAEEIAAKQAVIWGVIEDNGINSS